VPNGLFTRELVKQMREKGLSASDMLKRVRTTVESSAAAVNHAQRPSLVDESSSDFFFYPGSASAPAPAPAAAFSPPPAPAAAPAPVLPPPAQATAPTPAPAAAVRPPAPAPAAPVRVSDAQREFDAWEVAQRAGSRSALEGFVAQFPQGRYMPRARVLIGEMGTAPAATPAPAPKPAAAYNPQAEFEVWDRADTSKRKADYEAYVAAYPNGRYIDLARAALKKL